ncbi:MAG: 4a-hydroxytetrahydrobiopterin dehydratase [Thermoanaerobaculia bacterium]|jgi:4a-hydroxytetrahydrobiopterin dehydratase
MRTVGVTFYTRPGCHLCHDAKEAMLLWVTHRGFSIELTEVNIDEDEGAHERYWLHIPVATIGGREAFRHRFDPEAFERLAAAAAKGDVTMTDLASRSCVQCRGGVAPLRGDELKVLHEALGDGWTVEGEHHLVREYRFENFAGALALVNRIGEVAETEGHHPDLELGWGRVGVKIFTHAIDGLTESDFVMAAKIEQLANQGKGRQGQ